MRIGKLSIGIGVGLLVLGLRLDAQLFNPVNGSVYVGIVNNSFNGASDYARAHGGRLAVIRNAAENAFVAQNFPGYRIGLTDASLEGTFVWTADAPYGYRNWLAGEPNNQGNEDEVQVLSDGTWNDVPAFLNSGYVVEFPKFTIVSPISGKVFVLGSPLLTMNMMRTEAAAMGAHLATFESEAEEDAIAAELRKVHPGLQFVVGLNDEALEGTFVWASGEALTYSRWGPGEPNDAGGEDHVVVTLLQNSTTWNDVDVNGFQKRGLYEIDDIVTAKVNLEAYPLNCNPPFSNQPPAPMSIFVRTPIGGGFANESILSMPTDGGTWAYVIGDTASIHPIGGPLPSVTNPAFDAMVIGIPYGTIAIALDWEFICAEEAQFLFNDAMSIDVVSPTGTLIGNLMYADTSTNFVPGSTATYNYGSGCIAIPGTPVMPSGKKSAAAVFVGIGGESTIPPGSYLSISCRNGGDTLLTSTANVDNIRFVTRNVTLEMSAPTGAGSFRLGTRFGQPGALVFRVLTVGSIPPTPGWFYGIDIGLGDIAAQFGAGYPFVAFLDGNGEEFFTLTSGVVPGIPLVGVALEFTGGNPPLIVSKPAEFVTF